MRACQWYNNIMAQNPGNELVKIVEGICAGCRAYALAEWHSETRRLGQQKGAANGLSGAATPKQEDGFIQAPGSNACVEDLPVFGQMPGKDSAPFSGAVLRLADCGGAICR